MASIYDGNGDRVFSVSPKNYKVKSNNGNHYGQDNGNGGNGSDINNNGNGNNNGNNGNHYGNNKNNGNQNNNGNGNSNGNNGNHYGNNKDNECIFEEIPEGEKYTANVIDYNHNGKISVGEMKRANKEKQAEAEEMIFIPLGITHQNRNKYELIQYINDVTSENTQVLMEYGKKAKDTMAYNYGNERLSYEDAKNKNETETYTYNYDGRGSVTNILDNNATSMVEYSYNAFGETTIIGTQAKKTENRYQFNSENTDSVTGLQYLRARYYDSTIGRFITQDTYEGNIYDPLTKNQYLYTNNDPVNYTDPTGHFWKELWEYGKATVKTVVDVGKALINTAKNPTPQNIVNQIVTTKNNVTNNYKTAKNNIEASKKSKNTNTSNSRQTIAIAQGPKLPTTNSNRGAAVNSKAEKSKELENQIKLLRQQNTAEAHQLADYLQENMKKLCESSLGKIEISNVGMGKKWYEKIGEELKDKVYSVGATTSGFITSVANNVAGTDLSNLYLFEGYEKAYYGGTIGGDVASGIIGLAETIVGPIMAGMGILTIGGGISISSTGVGIAPGMAVSGVGVAITTVGVAATGQGIGIIGNSFNSLSDHIQNFKDSGTSGNNNQISNEVKNINEKRKA